MTGSIEQNCTQSPSHPTLQALDPDENFFNEVLGNLGTEYESKYYTINSYNSSFSSTSSNIDFMAYSVRSYKRNKDSFIAMLNSLYKHPEVVVLTETWLTPDAVDFQLLDGYIEHHTIRQGGRGGGVSVLCWDSIDVHFIPQLSLSNDSIESCVVEITHDGDKFVVLAVYRPHANTIENFNEALLNILHDDTLRGRSVVLLGDINIDLLKQDAPHVAAFVNFMQSVCFTPVITNATRFPPPGSQIAPSLLDHIWLNRLRTFTGGILCMDSTDHCLIFVKLPVDAANEKKIEVTFRIHHPNSYVELKNKVKELLNNRNQDSNIDAATTKLICDLNRLYTQCFLRK